MTLWFEAKSAQSESMQKLKVKTKLLASLAFVGFAWDLGAADSTYGQVMLAGLVLSLAGDGLADYADNQPGDFLALWH